MAWSAAYYSFAKSYTSVSSYTWTLDGNDYSALIKWNIFGQRYYIHLYDSSGALVLCKPLIGSETGVALDSLSWSLGTVTATTPNPHRFPMFQIVSLNVSGCSPEGYNGIYDAVITGEYSFTYSVESNPESSTTPGYVGPEINIVNGYFINSRLVFRKKTSNFEVWTYSE
jgi:hypothetical protein